MSALPAPQPATSEIEHLLHLMASRMSWRLGSKLVERANLYVSRGWGETIAAVRSRPPAAEALATVQSALETAFLWHTYVGNKQVTWYDLNVLPDDLRTPLVHWAATLDLNAVSQRYCVPNFISRRAPYLEADLAGLIGQPARLVAVGREGQKLYFQYFSARSYSLRESIDLTDWPDDQRARLGEFYEVIGVKLKSIPCFDTFVVDLAAMRLEVRIDFAPGMRQESQAVGVSRLLEEFNRLTMNELTLAPAGLGIVNFYPAVAGIYGDRGAGRVNMLGFVATSEDTSSNNRGQTLRRRDQDLRDDKFHVGGTGAVESVKPYTIGATWPSPSGLEPLTMELLGSVRMVYNTTPSAIKVANFVGCTDGRDFDFLTNELARQLPT